MLDARQEPWLESVINFPFFASCIVLEGFSLPARGFGRRAKQACCDSWGRKESDTTEWLNWTELNSHPYVNTGKTIASTRWTFVGRVTTYQTFDALSTNSAGFISSFQGMLWFGTTKILNKTELYASSKGKKESSSRLNHHQCDPHCSPARHSTVMQGSRRMLEKELQRASFQGPGDKHSDPQGVTSFVSEHSVDNKIQSTNKCIWSPRRQAKPSEEDEWSPGQG